MPLWGKRDDIISTPKFLTGTPRLQNVVFEDSVETYQDGLPGILDPFGSEGWYFKNTTAGSKINWYFYDPTLFPSAFNKATFFAVVVLRDQTSKPIVGVYTQPQGSGDAASWYRSRYAYIITTPVPSNTPFLIYTETDPVDVFPNLQHVKLSYSNTSTVGPRAPTELLLAASLGSNSGAAVNTVSFSSTEVGFKILTKSYVFPLRIKSRYTNQTLPESPKGSLSESRLIDNKEASNSKLKGISGPGWWKYSTYKDSNGNVRYKTECLVPMKIAPDDAGDRDDDFFGGKLSITSQPVNASVTLNANATFSVTASLQDSDSTVSYLWEESVDGITYYPITTARFPSYTVKATQTNANHLFRVRVAAYGVETIYSNSARLNLV